MRGISSRMTYTALREVPLDDSNFRALPPVRQNKLDPALNVETFEFLLSLNVLQSADERGPAEHC